MGRGTVGDLGYLGYVCHHVRRGVLDCVTPVCVMLCVVCG